MVYDSNTAILKSNDFHISCIVMIFFFLHSSIALNLISLKSCILMGVSCKVVVFGLRSVFIHSSLL